MKRSFIPLLCIVTASLSAQRIYEITFSVNRPYLENEGENWVLHLNPSKKVKTVEWKGKKDTDKSFMVLDENGYLKETKYFGYVRGFPFERKKYFHKKFEYTNLLATKVEYCNKKGEVVSYSQYEFFSPTKVRASKDFKKGKLIFEGVSKFNTDTTTAEYKAMRYKKGVARQSIRYEHDYYPGKQLKETRQYDGKNKLKQVWKYDCDPKGEVKVKKTNQVCRNLGIDNKGREIEVLFSTDHKGKKTKTINTFYKVNGKRVVVTREGYRIKKEKEIKWYEEHYPDSIESWYCYKNYDDEGVISFEHRRDYYQYGTKGIVMKSEGYTIYRRGKAGTKSIATYDTNGLVLKSESFDSRNRSLGRVDKEYKGDSLLISRNYNKKGKLRSTKTCHISYY